MSVIEKKYTRRLGVSYAKEFNTDRSTLWALVSTPNNLNDCHPFCQSNKVVKWGDGEYSDILVYLNGRTYLRRFQSWSEGSGYSLLIGEEDGPQSYVVWHIDSLSTSQSTPDHHRLSVHSSEITQAPGIPPSRTLGTPPASVLSQFGSVWVSISC